MTATRLEKFGFWLAEHYNNKDVTVTALVYNTLHADPDFLKACLQTNWRYNPAGFMHEITELDLDNAIDLRVSEDLFVRVAGPPPAPLALPEDSALPSDDEDDEDDEDE